MAPGPEGSPQVKLPEVQSAFLSCLFVPYPDPSSSSYPSSYQVAYGAGIFNQGTLTLTNSTISNNSALGRQVIPGGGVTLGGGICNFGNLLTITGSTLSDNSTIGIAAFGGGIYNVDSPLKIVESKILNNVARGPNGGLAHGGGIYSQDQDITIKASTISGNAASSATTGGGGGGIGGGIYLENGTLKFQTESNIVLNFASDEGGGICYVGYATGSISADSTVAKNIPDNIYSAP